MIEECFFKANEMHTSGIDVIEMRFRKTLRPGK